MKCPSNSEVDALLPASTKKTIDDVRSNIDDPSTNDVVKTPSVEVPKLMPILDEPLRSYDDAIREVPVTNPVSYDPPSRDSDGDDIQIKFANAQVNLSSLLPSRTHFQFLQASSSQPQINLDF